MTIAIRTEVGSISHGTLRSEDLLAAFSAELNALSCEHDMVKEAEAVLFLISQGWELDGAAMFDLVCSLQDELNEHCAENLYFGANEGDASDFGYWPIEHGNI